MAFAIDYLDCEQYLVVSRIRNLESSIDLK